jgi:hypothetical protein
MKSTPTLRRMRRRTVKLAGAKLEKHISFQNCWWRLKSYLKVVWMTSCSDSSRGSLKILGERST